VLFRLPYEGGAGHRGVALHRMRADVEPVSRLYSRPRSPTLLPHLRASHDGQGRSHRMDGRLQGSRRYPFAVTLRHRVRRYGVPAPVVLVATADADDTSAHDGVPGLR
jgi:hypothetical protein